MALFIDRLSKEYITVRMPYRLEWVERMRTMAERKWLEEDK